jgi:hypothetical protein
MTAEEGTLAYLVGGVDVQSHHLGSSPRGHEFGFLYTIGTSLKKFPPQNIMRAVKPNK